MTLDAPTFLAHYTFSVSRMRTDSSLHWFFGCFLISYTRLMFASPVEGPNLE
jgi:hypothetical protein